MSWVATAVAGGAVVGGGMGYLSGQKGGRDPYGTLNPEQRGLTQALGPYFNQSLANGPQLYGGQFMADIGANEQAQMARSQALINQSGQTLAGLQNYQDYDKLFRQEVETPTMDFFRREIQPTLEETLPTFSTARAGVVGRNLLGVTEQLAQQRFSGRENARQLALQAAGMTPATTQEMMRQAAVPRELQQAGLDKAYLDYTQANAQYQSSINQMLNFLGISTVTEKQDTRMQNAMAGVFGGAQMGLGIQGQVAQQDTNQQYLDYLTS